MCMKNLIKRVTVLALCFTLIMSCVAEATPQDLQNMSGRDITAAFKAQKLKVKKAKYKKNPIKNYDDYFTIDGFKEEVDFYTGSSKKNWVIVMVFEDSDYAINQFCHLLSCCAVGYIGNDIEYFRSGNVILGMSRKINRKTRIKYKKALKSIYNRPAQVTDQK